jgi:REP element-mobilizing transposase RayT
MPQSLSNVYTHIIFSTKHRENLIDIEVEQDLYNYLGGICRNFESNPVQVGGHKNHVHILCLLSRKISQMKLVQELKQSSSKWIKSKGNKYKNFYWQEGYGIFSVSPKNVQKVSEYIIKQESHHKNLSFQEEFRMFLDKFRIDYDERYLWD